jgi:hypothetical protein
MNHRKIKFALASLLAYLTGVALGLAFYTL